MASTGARGTRNAGTGDPAVSRTEVDGVPVFHGKDSGPLRAGLIFRVGQADETLPTRGLTHLVEHTALSGLGVPAHAYNGATGRTLTSFVIQGDPETVVEYLSGVTRALSDLPLDRLPHERQVLRVEGAERQANDRQSLWRWGARSYGLTAFNELGVDAVSDDAVRAWASQRFVRGAAALWLSGPPPAGLRLTLPDGRSVPPPDPHDSLGEMPGWFAGSDRGVALSWLSTNNSAARLMSYTLYQRLTQRLRHELALVYGVSGGADRVTADVTVQQLATEGLPDSGARLAAEFQAVVQTLLEEGVSDAELEAYRSRVRESLAQPEEPGDAPIAHAVAAVLGAPSPPSLNKIKTRLRQLTVEDADAELDLLADTLLLQVPQGTDVPEDLASPLPLSMAEPVFGRRYLPATAGAELPFKELVAGDGGITGHPESGSPITVRFDQVAVAFGYDDGSRTLIGLDGCSIFVAVEQWKDSAALVKQIDSRVADDVKVAGGARSAPEPTVPAQQRRRPLLIAGLIALLLLFVAVAGREEDPGTSPGDTVSADEFEVDEEVDEIPELDDQVGLRVGEVSPQDDKTLRVEVLLGGFDQARAVVLDLIEAPGFTVTPVQPLPVVLTTEPLKVAAFDLTVTNCELAPPLTSSGRAPRSYLQATVTLPSQQIIVVVGQDEAGRLANAIDRVVGGACPE